MQIAMNNKVYLEKILRNFVAEGKVQKFAIKAIRL